MFDGQVMFTQHSDKMSQRSQFLGSLFEVVLKIQLSLFFLFDCQVMSLHPSDQMYRHHKSIGFLFQGVLVAKCCQNLP